jgi:hypothetical protein
VNSIRSARHASMTSCGADRIWPFPSSSFFASLFSLFASVASLLSSDTSPLSLAPLSKTDGRLDSYFAAVKFSFEGMAVAQQHLDLRNPKSPINPVLLPCAGAIITLILLAAQVISAPYLNRIELHGSLTWNVFSRFLAASSNCKLRKPVETYALDTS